MLLARFDRPLDLPRDLPREERVALLGGKGDGLMRMAGELALPVPPGFVLTTRACRAFAERGWSDALEAHVLGEDEVLAARRPAGHEGRVLRHVAGHHAAIGLRGGGAVEDPVVQHPLVVDDRCPRRALLHAVER